MMEPEELVKGLRGCLEKKDCSECLIIYECHTDTLYKEIADTVERLLAERDAAVAGLADYRDCLYCKHYGKTRSQPPCNSCTTRREEFKLPWEWCGHVPEGGVKLNG